MGLKLTIDDAALNRQIAELAKQTPERATALLNDCLLDLAGKSAARAPIESGDLRNDCTATLNGAEIFAQGQATGTAPSSAAPSGEVGYGLPYALRQHEELSYRHDRTDGRMIRSGKNSGRTVNMVAGGEAKFLENPFLESRDAYLEHLREGLVKMVGG